MTQERFHDVDFPVIRDHVPALREITYEQFLAAVKKHKDTLPSHSYRPPNLLNVVPYLYQSNVTVELSDVDEEEQGEELTKRAKFKERTSSRRETASVICRSRGRRNTVFDLNALYDESDVQEERVVFVRYVTT